MKTPLVLKNSDLNYIMAQILAGKSSAELAMIYDTYPKKMRKNKEKAKTYATTWGRSWGQSKHTA